jgi:hypothetical protein
MMTITITDAADLRPGDVATLTLIEDERVQHQTIVARFDLNDSPPYILARSDVQDRYPLTAWRFVAATREVPEHKPGQTGTATANAERIRGMWMTSGVFMAPDERWWDADLVTDFVPDEAPRPLPTREEVAAAIQGDNRARAREFLLNHGVREDKILVSPSVFCVHPLDAATDVLALLTGKSDQHGEKCGDPSCDC